MFTKGEERRKHVRIFLPGGQVRVASGMLMALAGKVINISVGGVEFCSTAGFNPNDEIDLEVTLPTGMKFKCVARVVHFEQGTGNDNQVMYGAEFVELGARERLELGEYIMRKRAEQDDLLKKKLE